MLHCMQGIQEMLAEQHVNHINAILTFKLGLRAMCSENKPLHHIDIHRS